MITAVEVINQNGELLRVILDNPEASGFAIVGIDGITPGKANINIKDIATLDGGHFSNARVSFRNIVLNYVFIQDYGGGWTIPAHGGDRPVWIENHRSIEEARLEFYKYFPIKKPITLIFETDHPLPGGGLRRYMIQGYVESNEPDIFSDLEGAQVSVVCPNPFFKLIGEDDSGSGNQETIGFIQGGSFSFPWSNPWFQRTIEFGNLDEQVTDYDTEIRYTGDIDTGVIFKISIIGAFDHNQIWFYYYGTGEEPVLETSMRFNYLAYKAAGNPLINPGDTIVISTIPGQKYAILKQGAVDKDVFPFIDIMDDWIKFRPGDNRLRIHCGRVDAPANIYVTIEYPILYSGV